MSFYYMISTENSLVIRENTVNNTCLKNYQSVIYRVAGILTIKCIDHFSYTRKGKLWSSLGVGEFLACVNL